MKCWLSLLMSNCACLCFQLSLLTQALSPGSDFNFTNFPLRKAAYEHLKVQPDDSDSSVMCWWVFITFIIFCLFTVISVCIYKYSLTICVWFGITLRCTSWSMFLFFRFEGSDSKLVQSTPMQCVHSNFLYFWCFESKPAPASNCYFVQSTIEVAGYCGRCRFLVWFDRGLMLVSCCCLTLCSVVFVQDLSRTLAGALSALRDGPLWIYPWPFSSTFEELCRCLTSEHAASKGKLGVFLAYPAAPHTSVLRVPAYLSVSF